MGDSCRDELGSSSAGLLPGRSVGTRADGVGTAGYGEDMGMGATVGYAADLGGWKVGRLAEEMEAKDVVGAYEV